MREPEGDVPGRFVELLLFDFTSILLPLNNPPLGE
jgi:hypothetical protein